MSEKTIRNVVIIGAGYGGLSAAHYFMKHIYPALKKGGNTYRLHIVDQSTHFWWHLTAVRAMVKTDLMPHSKTFVPIKNGFEQYVCASTFYSIQRSCGIILVPKIGRLEHGCPRGIFGLY